MQDAGVDVHTARRAWAALAMSINRDAGQNGITAAVPQKVYSKTPPPSYYDTGASARDPNRLTTAQRAVPARRPPPGGAPVGQKTPLRGRGRPMLRGRPPAVAVKKPQYGRDMTFAGFYARNK